MDKDTRGHIQSATQDARRLLEKEFADQLEGTYDVLPSGEVKPHPGAHLTADQRLVREKIVVAIDHLCGTGMTKAEAVAQFTRSAAFTVLNRFVALKMLEARELVQECVTKGPESRGFKEFTSLSPALTSLGDGAYRLYLECIFDELSTGVKVLFDRSDEHSLLWPRRQVFAELLAIWNRRELDGIWGADETIGWVYQYFNSQEERRQMRDESQAPRNSRELAVRNQFFTPRYVVQFLTDNTLGRIWYEMRETRTALADKCEYMVKKPDEAFAPRVKKDPRDLKVLDPACGSGHFLLYAFDLLLVIYEEAWADPSSPKSEATGHTLAEDYPTVESLRRAVPGLVLAYNLHGVDIDTRCAQIAQLALWMRAQKAWRDFGVGRAERPPIRRSNIVVAEPLVADEQTLKDFVAKLGDAELGRVFAGLARSLNVAGELGLLLRVEELVVADFERASLFAPPIDRIGAAVERYYLETADAKNTRSRLFADDAAQGLGLLRVAKKCFDAVVMNPPFGEMPRQIQDYADTHYSEGRNDIYAVFVRRASELAARANGRVGALTSRAFVTGRDHRHFRRSLLTAPDEQLTLFADLGAGVLDGAMVETAAFVLSPAGPGPNAVEFIDARQCERRVLADELLRAPRVTWPTARFLGLPQADLLYDLDDASYESLSNGGAAFEPTIGRVTFGLTTKDDFRYVRLRWEVPLSLIGHDQPWSPFAKGGEYSWFTSTTHLLVRQGRGADEIAAFAELRDGNVASTRRSSTYYFMPAVCFSRRSQRGFSVRRLRPNACFSDKTAVIVPRPGQEQWLGALAPVLASTEYQRLIAAQSKFGSYEIGPVKALPVPDERALSQMPQWNRLYEYFDMVESCDETSEIFWGLPSPEWSPLQGWGKARASLVDGLAACGLNADAEVLRQLDAWVEDRDSRHDPEGARRSWAMGVIWGRFGPVQPVRGHLVLPHFGAPDSVPPGCAKAAQGPLVLVDDPGHADDVVQRLSAVLSHVNVEELRDWLRSRFWVEHLVTYSRSRRTAPIYWQLGTPSASYSVWLYIHAFSKDTLHRVLDNYVKPKLQHEERRLDTLRAEVGHSPTGAERKELERQETFVDELRTFRDELARVAPLWDPDLDDGVVINAAPLWRLFAHTPSWAKECKAKWDELVNENYDWAHLAMRLWPERVVPKCVDDRSLAIAHGLEDTFWVEGKDGKWTKRPVDDATVQRLIDERTRPAVKAALQSLLDAGEAGSQRGRAKAPRAARAARTSTATPAAEQAQATDAATLHSRGGHDELVLQQVVAAIRGKPAGASKADVLAVVPLSDGQWNAAIQKLIDDGEVERTGNKRAARYTVRTGRLL